MGLEDKQQSVFVRSVFASVQLSNIASGIQRSALLTCKAREAQLAVRVNHTLRTQWQRRWRYSGIGVMGQDVRLEDYTVFLTLYICLVF